MAQLWEGTLECDGECGGRIELSSRQKADVAHGILMSVAELLGWTTRDKPKKRGKVPDEVEVYCPFCQRKAERIVKGT